MIKVLEFNITSYPELRSFMENGSVDLENAIPLFQ